VVRAHPTVPLINDLDFVCGLRLASCATSSHDLSWPSAGALARIACCGRPRSASRAARPSSSVVRAVVFAIGSWAVCGDVAGRIKPLDEASAPPSCVTERTGLCFSRRSRSGTIISRASRRVSRSDASLQIFQRSFEHEGLFERRVLVMPQALDFRSNKFDIRHCPVPIFGGAGT
jgi:hypothetical protein